MLFVLLTRLGEVALRGMVCCRGVVALLLGTLFLAPYSAIATKPLAL